MDKHAVKMKEDLIQLHLSELKRYTFLWKTLQEPDEDEIVYQDEAVSKEEVAAGLLEHFGMFYRYTGNKDMYHQFKSMPEEHRLALSYAAATHLAQSDAAEQAQKLWHKEILTETDYVNAEHFFFLRDEMSVVIDMIKTLTWNILEEKREPELLNIFIQAVQKEEALDSVMRSNPSLAYAAKTVRALNECAETGIYPERQWWLTSQQEEEAETLQTTLDHALDRLIQSNTTSPDSVSDTPTLWEQLAQWFVEKITDLPPAPRKMQLAYAAPSPSFWLQLEEDEQIQLECACIQKTLQVTLHSANHNIVPGQMRLQILSVSGLTQTIVLDQSGNAILPIQDACDLASIQEIYLIDPEENSLGRFMRE